MVKLLQKKGMYSRYKKISSGAISSILYEGKSFDLVYSSDKWSSFNRCHYFLKLFSFKNFIFSYIISNFDKSRRKNLKNSSEKYNFLVKYNPIYKRFNTALKILLKEVKFYTNNRLKDKIVQFMQNLLTNKMYFYNKYNLFVAKYVFKNFSNSLFINYKTKK